MGGGVCGCIGGFFGSLTTTSPGFEMLASPQITSILFFFISMPTPPLRRPDTPRERCTMAAASKPIFSADETVILGVLHVVIDLGGAQQRLGGNAAPVQADAAQMLALDDRGLEPELRCADRRDVAARSAADDDDVVWSVISSALVFPLPLAGRG